MRALRQMVRTELGLVGAILAVTAILTTYTSPHV
jgi:putative copper export protein